MIAPTLRGGKSELRRAGCLVTQGAREGWKAQQRVDVPRPDIRDGGQGETVR